MIGPELQKAQVGALTAANVAGKRIYDEPPASPEFPYVTIGDDQVIDDSGACGSAWEVFTDIHVWSRPKSGSRAELKTLRAQIVPLLATELTIAGFRVAAGMLETARSLTDPDGKTKHDVLTFRYLIDPAS